MTEKKISYALNRIKACKESGFTLEALLRSYHLNLDIIKYILNDSTSDYSVKGKKIKAIVHELEEEISTDPKLKSILNKKNLKTVNPWLEKMDHFFKKLKIEQPKPVTLKALQSETEQVFGILNISANKLFVSHQD